MSWAILSFLGALAIRGTQAVFDALPYLVVGTLAAGIIEVIGSQRISKAFRGRVRGPFLAAGLGLLVPVCSIGVLPMLVALHCAKMPRGAWLTLTLCTACLNPLSIAYGLTLISPDLLALYATLCLGLPILIGILAGREQAEDDTIPSLEPLPSHYHFGLRRITAVVWNGAITLTGAAVLPIAFAVLGAGLLGAGIPNGSLQTTMNADDLKAPLVMVPISLSAHVTPERVVMLLGELFEHTSSPGAAYLFLLLGAGLNLGVIFLILRTAQRPHTLRAFAIYLAAALGIAYTLHCFLQVPGPEDSHTHVFDRMTNPFSNWHDVRYFESVARKELFPLPLIPLAAVAALAGLGLLGRNPALRARVESALTRQPVSPAPSSSVWSVPLPPRFLALGTAAAAIAAIAAFLMIYYPAPEELFDEMRMTRADALSAVYSQQSPAALRSLKTWDTLAGKLAIGSLIHRGPLLEPQRDSARDLRESLDELTQAVSSGAELDEARRIATTVETAYLRARQAFNRP